MNSIKWMDAETKVAALAKFSKLRFNIGYPDFYDDSDLTLFSSHMNYTVNRRDFYANVENSMQLKVKLSLQRLFTSRNPDEWLTSPRSTDAHYKEQTNEVVFPAGILQKPLYDFENPIAVNYGAFGSILGHEIMHAFDRHGAMYDLNGLDNFWWSNHTLRKFNQESDCVVNSYLKYINETGQVFSHHSCIESLISDCSVKRAKKQQCAP